ncbi:MFS transporter [Fodinisporobacter ferrooxydans]|uniref:MFS transporter n=1 Tax=Fodinisporobacter ferrooxydans TaxID=2901836 RepID=A0ABY4CM66_9BACL|nr:MFS transporter [Alicyclobacillaceae bacterium MYW30-H2]
MTRIQMHSIVKRLILIRGLRSIGQGAMVVDLSLYLKDLHWSGALIGGVTSAAGLFGAALILFVGILSDKLGRKPFLLIYEGMTMLSSMIASMTTQGIILILAIVIAGFGRGQSGAAGPFSPAEQAWLARYVERSNRGQIFSLNNGVGFLGMAIGSVLGGIPGYIHTANPLEAYRPVFLMVTVLSFFCILLLSLIHEQSIGSAVGQSSHGRDFRDKSHSVQRSEENGKNIVKEQDPDETNIRRQENKAIFKLAFINTLNGLAVGLTGPMMAYWFSIRYHVGTEAIGVTLSISFFLTAVSSYFSGILAQRFGMVKSVTWMRIIGSACMLALPWMPTFTIASFLFVIRNAINRGTQGNRSALSASLTRDQRRGFASSINALSMRLPSSVGPTLTGYMFDVGQLNLPLILTAALQLVNAGIYQRVFGEYDKKK